MTVSTRSPSQPKRRARKPRRCAAAVIGWKAGRLGLDGDGLGFRFRLGLGLGLRLRLGLWFRLRLGLLNVDGEDHLGAPSGGLDLHAPVHAIALPDDLGLRLEPRDADLAELAKVAGQGRRIAQLGPELRGRLHQPSLCLHLGHRRDDSTVARGRPADAGDLSAGLDFHQVDDEQEHDPDRRHQCVRQPHPVAVGIRERQVLRRRLPPRPASGRPRRPPAPAAARPRARARRRRAGKGRIRSSSTRRRRRCMARRSPW